MCKGIAQEIGRRDYDLFFLNLFEFGEIFHVFGKVEGCNDASFGGVATYGAGVVEKSSCQAVWMVLVHLVAQGVGKNHWTGEKEQEKERETCFRHHGRLGWLLLGERGVFYP